MRIEWVIFFTVLLFSSGATADPDRDNLLRKAVSDAFPDVEITRIKPAPIPGLYEVMKKILESIPASETIDFAPPGHGSNRLPPGRWYATFCTGDLPLTWARESLI